MGNILNVPESFLKRHPFPGPGLAVRVLGDVTEGNALEILRQVCLLFYFSSLSNHCAGNIAFTLDIIFIIRWMRFSFSPSKRLVFMIPSGKLLLFFYQCNRLVSRVTKEPILMWLFLEQLPVKME